MSGSVKLCLSTPHTAVNSGLGVSIYSQDKTDFEDLTLLWVYLAYAVFTVVLGCVLFVLFTGEAVIFKIDGTYTCTVAMPTHSK